MRTVLVFAACLGSSACAGGIIEREEAPVPVALVRTAEASAAAPTSDRAATPEATEPPSPPSPALPRVVAAPAGLDRDEVRRLLADDPASLGSLSAGRPNRGALLNPVTLSDGPLWHVVDPKRAHGTAESVRSIMEAVLHVEAEHPGSPRLFIGHLSGERGGYLRPHRSHQSGRDVDIGFYYRDGERWYARATAENLDLPRTWALVRAFIDDPNIENIFVDRSVQKLLRGYAERAGARPEWLSSIFQERRREEKLIRHEWGHLTHLHVRFRSVQAQEGGRVVHPELVASRRIPARKYY